MYETTEAIVLAIVSVPAMMPVLLSDAAEAAASGIGSNDPLTVRLSAWLTSEAEARLTVVVPPVRLGLTCSIDAAVGRLPSAGSMI